MLAMSYVSILEKLMKNMKENIELLFRNFN